MKLHHYGLRGIALDWIKTFLAIHSQRVVENGEASKPAPVTFTVPQGTVLGQLLFLVYINDLPHEVNSTSRLLPGDCLLYRVIESEEIPTSFRKPRQASELGKDMADKL
jgi:hypothetical protein